ncbi:MAG TPA: hypothetical protein VFB25_02520 [Gaiellaceae bacterium]|nr:hypothetical protein [Gaiellaceae bacterium]
MRTSALRRAVTAWIVLSICALLLGSGVVGNTFATFSAETSNAGTPSVGWIGQASSASVTPGGYDNTLSWTPTTTGPIGAQSIAGVDNGTNSNCIGAAYSTLYSGLSATLNTKTDLNRGTGTTDGDWYCYEIIENGTSGTFASNWSSPGYVVGTQLGIVANKVTVANGTGTSGTIDSGDTITVTFNQQQSTLANATGVHVCTWSTTNQIVIGDSHGGTCHASGDNYTIGVLTLSGGDTIVSSVSFASSSISVSTLAPWTVTIKLGGSNSSLIHGSATPVWTFTPVSGIVSAQTSDQATICTSGTNCQPATNTTNF